MEYKKEFKDYLDLAEKCGQTYVGHGNPNAPVLIIANEPGVVDETFIINDLEKNREMWETNRSGKCSFSQVEEMFDGDNLVWPRFNPLWPYKGQRFVQIKVKNDSNGNTTIVNRNKRPTSRSWIQNQKIVDQIYRKTKKEKGASLDFFERAFITDFSAIYGLHSNDISQEARLASIKMRLPLFGSPFINQFPITIVASGHYIRDIALLSDLTKVFPGFSPNRIERITGKPGWMNVHISDDGKRILVHTKHFASAISDPYLTAIALKCREFLNPQ